MSERRGREVEGEGGREMEGEGGDEGQLEPLDGTPIQVHITYRIRIIFPGYLILCVSNSRISRVY